MRRQEDANMNVRISSEADMELDGAAAYFGMTKKEMLGRLLRWFAEQDRITQAAVMGTLPASVDVNLPRLILEREAAKGPAAAADAPDPGKALAQARDADRKGTRQKRA
jgi:hypothetical protein